MRSLIYLSILLNNLIFFLYISLQPQPNPNSTQKFPQPEAAINPTSTPNPNPQTPKSYLPRPHLPNNQMFNAFQNDKLIQQSDLKFKSQEATLQSLSTQQRLREKLSVQNRKRVKTRLLQMSLDPVPISRKLYVLPLEDFKGAKFFRHRPKNTQERVQDAEFHNQWLDTVPLLPSGPDFRPRYKAKEIHSDMKFTPKDRYERIKDAWHSQLDRLDSSWHVSPASREVFPSTLRRSYYKTVESVALDGHTGSLNLGKMSSGEETDRSLAQVAQEVMDKCRLRPLKDEIRSSYQSRSASIPGR